MTTYGAYDAGLPCKNTACKSHGKPHPNCRCYGDMAEGGEVGNYCDKQQDHKEDCEYYVNMSAPVLFGEHSHLHPNEAVAGYLSHHGLHGILKLHHEHPETALKRYDHSIKKGHKHIEKNLEHLFSGGVSEKIDHSKQKSYIDEWINKGGAHDDIMEEIYAKNSPQNFADGGQVKKQKTSMHHEHPISTVYPEHNTILQMTKSRVSDYLNSLKPQTNMAALPFDMATPTPDKKKSYEKALGIAAHPLKILRKIQKGTLEPEQVKHFNAMYPELADHLQKKLTEKIMQAQLKGEKPSSKVRQSLSMFMGATLATEFTPQMIQAAQATFKVQNQKPQEGQAPKAKTSALSKSYESLLTRNQASATRQQKQ